MPFHRPIRPSEYISRSSSKTRPVHFPYRGWQWCTSAPDRSRWWEFHSISPNRNNCLRAAYQWFLWWTARQKIKARIQYRFSSDWKILSARIPKTRFPIFYNCSKPFRWPEEADNHIKTVPSVPPEHRPKYARSAYPHPGLCIRRRAAQWRLQRSARTLSLFFALSGQFPQKQPQNRNTEALCWLPWKQVRRKPSPHIHLSAQLKWPYKA